MILKNLQLYRAKIVFSGVLMLQVLFFLSFPICGNLFAAVKPQITSGEQCCLALLSDGTVWAWGYNGYGQLGDGTTTDRSIPVQVKGLEDVIAIAGGGYHNLVLKADGTVLAWGDNTKGQLGDGTNRDKNTPVMISGLKGVVAISDGGWHSLALKSDGTVWAWGDNGYGQLGDGTTTNKNSPVQVRGLDNIIAISGGCEHSLALRSDGTVWAWGENYKGQLGNGENTIRVNYPVQVDKLTRVVAIAAGGGHSLALKSDGTVWAWGDDGYGQLGDGTSIDRDVPIQVHGINNIIEIAGGGGHSLALMSDGTVWAWGNNEYGQLGNGIAAHKSTVPVKAVKLSSVIAIDCGWRHSIAMKSDGTIWGWGINWHGELGDGTVNDRIVPFKSRIIAQIDM